MLTPQEAASTWCPMVRIARREDTVSKTENLASKPVVVAGCNTDALGHTRVPASCTCIADKCAMWRWKALMGPRLEIKTDGPPGRENYSVRTIGPITPTHGYCGLAGAPASLLP